MTYITQLDAIGERQAETLERIAATAELAADVQTALPSGYVLSESYDRLHSATSSIGVSLTTLATELGVPIPPVLE